MKLANSKKEDRERKREGDRGKIGTNVTRKLFPTNKNSERTTRNEKRSKIIRIELFKATDELSIDRFRSHTRSEK